VPLVAQHADDFGCESFVEDLDNRFPIGLVALGHGAALDMFAGPFPQCFDV
jgi:hypothetical protein